MESGNVGVTALVNYLTYILTCYFSPVSPQIMTIPAKEEEEFILNFVGLQFRALMEIGIPINHGRFAGFFERANAPSLFSEETILNKEDITKRLFISMQGSVEHPQELVILVVQGLNIIDVKHVIGANKKPSYVETLDQKHVHGMVSFPHRYISREKMIELLRRVIIEDNPMEIVHWDDRLNSFIPSLGRRVVKIKCPHWNFRMAHYSHQAALKFKLKEIDWRWHTEESGHNHSKYVGTQSQPVTLGEFTQQNYGYECALINAYELMHYYMAKPETKIPF